MIGDTRVWPPGLARQCLLLLAISLLSGVAAAQVDYSAGKTPEQLFSSDCSACHASPQSVGRDRDLRALTAFLGQHYTTKTQWAALIANYLIRMRDAPPIATTREESTPKNNQNEAKSVPETLISKLRNYATAGEEAKAPAGPLNR